jgi:glycerate kinase
MRILIAPDKFKGSLSAAEAAAAIARGIGEAFPGAVLDTRPIADGGEGFAGVLSPQWTTSLKVPDALGRPVPAEYGWRDPKTAVIEMSAASGLWRIAPSERAPLFSSTRGTGELIGDAIARGAATILVGIGGSAANDGGAGMAAALGFRFLDSDENALDPVPFHLSRVAAIVPPPKRESPRIIAACDVDNPLLGPQGATRTFGRQKGASPADLEILENALANLAAIVLRELGVDFRGVPGAGAAGGLGFGLMSFCGAEIRSGFELVAEVTGLETAIVASDLVITGEGKIDAQTLRGKGPAGMAALARKHAKPIIAVAGRVEPGVGSAFDAVYSLEGPGLSHEESMSNAAALLESIAREKVAAFVANKIAISQIGRI